MTSRYLLGQKAESNPERSEIRDLSDPVADDLSSVGPQFMLFDYWRVLVKHRWVFFSAVVFMLAAAALVSLRSTPMYRATGQIVIDKDNTNPLGLKDGNATSGNGADSLSVDLATQVRILKSNLIAQLALHKLQLRGQLADPVNVAGSRSSGVLTGPPEISKEQQDNLVRAFQAALEVTSIPDTRVVQIAFVSKSPRTAADAANAMIEAYIEQNLKSHFDATTQAAEWLTKQLSDLQIKTEISEQKLVRYQKEHGIVGTDEKQNIITSKLEDLNKELTQAEADRIQKQAFYDSTISGDPEAVNAVGQDMLLTTLRTQQAQLRAELAQASVQMGSAYPKIVEIRNQLQQLDDAIDQELRKTSNRIHNDYLAALGREKILQKAFDKQKEDASQLNQNAIEYYLLKRDADSNRQLYDSLMQNLKQAGLLAGLSSSNVHIVDSATVPPGPFTPDIPRNMEIGLLIGLTSGVALAFVFEGLDSSVRTPDQAEAITFLPSLAVVPLANKAQLVGSTKRRRLDSHSENVNETALLAYTRPRSQVAEAYRGLRTSILLSLPDAPPKIILVTSPLPQDGKSTTSINTAIVLAQEGRRVLLVDADLRRPAICKALGIQSSEGLTTVLAGYRTSESLILPSPHLPNLFVLPAGLVSPRPSEMLSSEHMKRLLTQWRQMFDHVIIDSPPVLAVTDAVRLSVEADAVLMVVRSSQTTKAALRRASIMLGQVKARMLGVVVNALDLRSADRYYYYYSGGKYAQDYYGSDNSKETSD